MDIPSGFWLVNTAIQIVMGEIHIFCYQQDHQIEICPICHLVSATIECLCHSRYCGFHGWFLGWRNGSMYPRWSCLDLIKLVGHRNRSVQWKRFLFLPNNSKTVTLSHLHPFVKCIHIQHWLQQSYINHHTEQSAYHSCCPWGTCVAKTHFMCHQWSQYFRIPNPCPHNEPCCPN